MTFNEAEEFWKKQLNKLTAEEDTDRVLFCSADIGMIEATLKAFETIREYEVDLAREKELNYKNLVASVINYADDSEAERAEATFNVDNYKITITAERKEE